MKLFRAVLAVVLVGLLAALLTSFVSQPERYLSTWRYQLKNDIARGDEAAIEYYEENYLAKGIYLFNEN